MSSIAIFVAIILLLFSNNKEVRGNLPEHNPDDRLPESFHLEVCDNAVVKSIPGGAAEVLRVGKLYLESMKNKTDEQKAPFAHKWKWEVFRMAGPSMTECTNFKQFGDAAKNFDETKRFCDITANYTEGQSCMAYSLGSNNKWFFEEHMHKMTNCSIETFDCTCDATIPSTIVDRTTYYKKCVSSSNIMNTKKWQFVTYMEAMELIKAKKARENSTNVTAILEKMRGPEYLKIDVEGFEWSFLRSLVVHNSQHPEFEHLMPLQVYGEFHLGQDADSRNDPLIIEGYVGKKLRHYLDNLFIRGGYMTMYLGTTHQTRNTDILLVKVFCHRSQNMNRTNHSSFVLTGKVRQDFKDNVLIDNDSLGFGYTSPLASQGRKDSSYGSLSQIPQSIEPEAVFQGQSSPDITWSNDGITITDRSSYGLANTLTDKAILIQKANLRSPQRNSFGSTGARPLDKQRTNFAVLNSQQVGHGPHPQDKKLAALRVASIHN